MSSQGFCAPIVIDSAPSPRLLAAAGALSVLAAAAVATLSLPFTARAGLLLMLAAGAYDLFRTLGLPPRRRSLRRIELDAANEWRLTDRTGCVFAARLLPGARVTVSLIALRWRDERGRRHSILLAADASDREALRRLRVRLRIGGTELLDSRTRNWVAKRVKRSKQLRTFRSGAGL
ncbi:MAG TPA: protein YgfX [Gammaproteobacteria bacterium]|nr:protein YgfX [Gammaproteobacteria bacterium]